MERLEKRVCDLFVARFGTELQIRWLESEKVDVGMVKNWQTTFVYSCTRKQVSFPVFCERKKLKAIAVAYPVDNSDVIHFKDMVDFLQLTIAEMISLDERYTVIERSEEAFNFSHNESSNIVRWPRKAQTQQPNCTLPPIKKEAKGLLDPIWVYGDNDPFAGKIAIDIHDWVRNWAFFNVKEIPDLFWQGNEPWSKLSQTTIYISDVDKLTAAQMEILKANLEALRYKRENKPLIVVSSQQPPDEVAADLKWQFKVYQYHDKTNAKSQAHFLLYQFSQERLWEFRSHSLNRLTFLPFSKQSDLLH